MGRKKSKKGSGGSRAFNKKNLRNEIYDFMATQPDTPLNHKQISAGLGIKDAGMRMLIYELLMEGVHEERLSQAQRGKFKLKAFKKEVVEGVIEITKGGRGFVIVEGMDEDVKVRHSELGCSLYGDTVEISVYNKKGRTYGKVERIVKRARETYVGTIQISQKHAFVVASNEKIHMDFYVSLKNIKDAKDGDKVVVRMTDWDNPERSPFGEVVSVLGAPGDNDTEMHAIMAEYELPYEFPPHVEREAEKISKIISDEEISKRRDMREVITFTIDPDTAKDFDDALSLQKLENGNWEVGVHIADVSHYMQPGTILEEEARQRATSVYLVDRVVPMLPEILSNELCSLVPHTDKLCFSAVFELNDKAQIQKEWFGRTVIHSDRRFTYEEAQERIEGLDGDFKDEILELDRLSKLLRKERFKSGSLDFSSEEVKFRLDENGKPLGVFTKVMKDANKLIEDFMLLANRRVARFIGGAQNKEIKTFVYRIHDLPDAQKLAELKRFVSFLGYELPDLDPETNAKGELNKLLLKVDGKPEAEAVRQLSIRTMAKAVYSTKNIGHFGLSFDYYSHFTSPIRRYPDVMVHRLLAHYLDGGKSADASDNEKLCKHSSMQEKKAAEAERSSIKYKQVEYLLDQIGEHFQGTVSGITGWGIYVELDENKCEGMVSLKGMSHDNFHFDEEAYAIIGSRTGERYTLGDKVEVKVARADLVKKQLDFEMVY